MRDKIRLKEILVTILVAIVVVIGSLVTYGSYGLDKVVTQPYLLLGICVLILAFSYRVNLLTLRKLYLWFFLTVTVILSEILCGRSHTPNLIILLLSVFAMERFKVSVLKMFAIAVVLAQLPFVLQYGLNSLFNSYALVIALCGFVLMGFIYMREKKNLVLLYVLFFVIFTVLFALQSRTALLGFTVAGMFIILSGISDMKRNRLIPLCVLTAILIAVLYVYYDQIYNLLFKKWSALGYSDKDLSVGRIEIWKDVIQNKLSLWGHKENFFLQNYHHEDAHNIFIQMIGKYGVLAASIFILWCIDIIRRIRIISDTKIRKYFYAFWLECLVLGVTENVLLFDVKTFAVSVLIVIHLVWLYKLSYEARKESL